MMLDINTVLKLARTVVKNYSQGNSHPGLIFNKNGQKIKVKFTELISALDELSEKDLVVVRRCKDCDNWYRTNRKIGACFPKDYTCSKKSEDFCSSSYVLRSPERRKRDEAICKLSPKK